MLTALTADKADDCQFAFLLGLQISIFFYVYSWTFKIILAETTGRSLVTDLAQDTHLQSMRLSELLISKYVIPRLDNLVCDVSVALTQEVVLIRECTGWFCAINVNESHARQEPQSRKRLREIQL